jgi:hypothetical protein
MDKSLLKLNISSKDNKTDDDLYFWKNQPRELRLEALETLRKRYCLYMGYDYGHFHRVYKVVTKV